MTLLAAFQTLLYRYSGQQDIAVGTPIAGRTRQETEGLIGFFVNTLVLRTDLSNNPTFKELLRQSPRNDSRSLYVTKTCPSRNSWRNYIPSATPASRHCSRSCSNFQNAGDRSLDLEGLSAIPIRTSSSTAKFDLSLTVTDRQGDLRASLNYNTDLFDAATIARMLAHFQTLLEGIVANPDQRISELPLLTEAEKHQLLVEWNDTKTDYPKDKCIHQTVRRAG